MTKKVKTAKKAAVLPPTGRSPGSTLYSEDKFFRKTIAAYKAFTKRGKQPTRAKLAARLGISRSTFYRHLERYNSWDEIHQAALEED